ncbi:MAG: hypothetical protein WA908_01485 [Pontixanthobacter sp.]
MALSAATTGHGARLFINATGTLERVAQLDDLPELPLSTDRELYETTNFDSVEYKEFKKQPLKEGVPITITGNYVILSASDALLQAADDADEALPYSIEVTEGEEAFEITGNGLFYGLKRMNPKDAKRMFEITLKPVDKPVLAPVSN